MIIKENKAKSIPERNLYTILKLYEKAFSLKGKFYLNVKTDNHALFEQSFFTEFKMAKSNKKLTKYLSAALKKASIHTDVEQCLSMCKKQTIFECDLIYVVNGRIVAIIEIQGPHHREPYVFGGLSNFISTKVSDFIKKDYCEKYGILFYEFTTNGYSVSEDVDELIKILKRLESNN